jgi:shikimate kinase
MGAGKTSVGQALAARLKWRFVDLDDRIEAREGRAIRDIFEHSGEPAFRKTESAELQILLKELSASATVAALGGGAFVQPENAAILGAFASPIVFLDAPVETLAERCGSATGGRPLFRDPQSFQELYEARRPAYMSATLRVNTAGKSVKEVADEIISLLRLRTEAKESQ